jgi:hypothetical protein
MIVIINTITNNINIIDSCFISNRIVNRSDSCKDNSNGRGICTNVYDLLIYNSNRRRIVTTNANSGSSCINIRDKIG